MSALAHHLEEAGIASVAISLIRPHTERIRPPRALWVPFELGRPFGPPNDPAFQKRVIIAALRLLERRDGPVVLEDFPDDDPRERPDSNWRPPLTAASAGDPDPAALATRLEAEIPLLARDYDRSVAERGGRTTVGLAGMSIADCGRHVAAWLRGAPPESPHADMSSVLTLRFAVDDLKAYYLEAAIAGGARPSSRQLGDWFWNQTAAGGAFFALRRAGLASTDDRFKAIAGLFLVPGVRALAAG